MKKKYYRPNCIVLHLAPNAILAGSIPVSNDERNNISGDAKSSSLRWHDDED